MDKEYLNQLLSSGFNVMPLNNDKRPLRLDDGSFYKWKVWQDKKVPSLGVFPKTSEVYGLICGFNDVEVIDVDLKFIPDLIQRREFWHELISEMKLLIDDFDNRIVVRKTQNEGYHIIYQAYNIEGSKKLAKLKDGKESVIETKGVGGYVVMYPNSGNRNYHSISYISEDERDALIQLCKTYDYPEAQKEEVIPVKVRREYSESPTTPWNDYNQKANIWDIIRSDFEIVKRRSDRYLVKRIGTKNQYSGTLFLSNNCLWLFTDNTVYPQNELITPFKALVAKKYNGDFSQAASDLYKDGFGSRHKPILKGNYEEKTKIPDKVFPIDIFSKEVQQYLLSCHKTQNSSLDYMGCALLWAGSLMIGNSIKIRINAGWSEIPTIWVACVGEAGWGKTPSMSAITKPLEKINVRQIKEFSKKEKQYKEYQELSKKEKEVAIEVTEPYNTQFIIDDTTIEALVNLHSQNPGGIGVFKDELAGWFKDMNKYKEGSDKEKFLSIWSGKALISNRISRATDVVSKPLIPVLGGIQPGILKGFFTDENKDSGFLDRMLFTVPDIEVSYWSKETVNKELIDYFQNWMLSTHDTLKQLIAFDDKGEVSPRYTSWGEGAEEEWERIFNSITDKERSDNVPEFIKSVLPKHKTYIARFALIINTLNSIDKPEQLFSISRDSLLKAKKLSDYFLSMNMKLLSNGFEASDMEIIVKAAKGGAKGKVEAVLKSIPNFNKSKLAKLLNISRNTIRKYVEEIESGK